MKDKILFLCSGNSCRSQIAEGLFNNRNNYMKAYSGGLKPLGYINPYAIDIMKEISIDISKQSSKMLPNDLSTYYIFVLCDCSQSCPDLHRERFYEVPVKDPSEGVHDIRNYREVREKIEIIVDDIIECLTSDNIEIKLNEKFMK